MPIRAIFWTIVILLGASLAHAGELLLSKEQLGRPQSGTGKIYLIAIGVSRYQDDFWPKLKWPKKDAEDLAAVIGEQMNEPRVAVAITNEVATLANVRTAFDKIKAQLTPRDSLVVYISAHGTLATNKNGEMEKVTVLYDTRKDHLLTTGLRYQEIYDELRQVHATKTLLILATCHSGIGKSKFTDDVQKLLAGAKGQTLMIEERSEALLVLAAAEQGETAHESDQLQGDLYTHFLIEGLHVYDRNQDGAYSALEAHDYATIKTYAATNGKQRPTAEIRMIGTGDMVLRGKKSSRGLPVLTAYNFHTLSLEVEGGEKGALPLAFPLKAGVNQIALYEEGASQPLSRYRIKAGMGETVSLSELIAGPPYSLGLAFYRTSFLASDYRRLTGAATGSMVRLAGTYERQGWCLGGVIDQGLRQSHSVRRNLDMTLDSVGIGIAGGLIYNFMNGAGVSFELLLMQDSVAISFSDSSGSNELGYNKAVLAYGYQLGYRHALTGRLQLALDLTQKFSKMDFGDIGSLDRGYIAMGAGLFLRLGGYGVKL